MPGSLNAQGQAAGDGPQVVSEFLTKITVSDRPHPTLVCANQRPSSTFGAQERVLCSQPLFIPSILCDLCDLLCLSYLTCHSLSAFHLEKIIFFLVIARYAEQAFQFAAAKVGDSNRAAFSDTFNPAEFK